MKLYNCESREELDLKKIELELLTNKELISLAAEIKELFDDSVLLDEFIVVNALLQIINESGGFSVLAHPYSLSKNTKFESLIPYMKRYGLRGIESNTIRNTMKQMKFFQNIAEEYNLIKTAGTDFHDFSNDSTFGIEVEENFLNDFHKLIRK